MAVMLRIHPDNPQERLLEQAVKILESGGVIIYPTDTIYAIGCSIFQHKAVERIARLKNIDPLKVQLSFICPNLSDLSTYARQVDTPTFRLLKQYLPGPFTFILLASKQVPKILQTKKSTIGLRIPDNEIALQLIKKLGHPIVSASLPGEMVEDYTDPDLMYENFEKLVDLVIDGGMGGMIPSTIIDFTQETPLVLREGKGIWNE